MGADATSATPYSHLLSPPFSWYFPCCLSSPRGWTLPKGQHLCTVPVRAAVPLGASQADAPLWGCAARSLCATQEALPWGSSDATWSATSLGITRLQQQGSLCNTWELLLAMYRIFQPH